MYASVQFIRHHLEFNLARVMATISSFIKVNLLLRLSSVLCPLNRLQVDSFLNHFP